MFNVKHKQRNIHKEIVIALVLVLFVVCTINVQFYIEHQIASHVTTYTSGLKTQENLFNMSIEELMEVTVIAQPQG